MDVVKIYTNSQNIMDYEAAKRSIISIAKKFYINHINFLNEDSRHTISQKEKNILCEIQIEPYLDSEIQVDFNLSKSEFNDQYGYEYDYFQKNDDIINLNAFIIRLKRERDTFIELAQLYKILQYFRQKFQFANSQNLSVSHEIYEEVNLLRKSAIKLLPGIELREINYKLHFDTNNRVFKLKELNRKQEQLFKENQQKNATNLIKTISGINIRLEQLFKIDDPNSIEKNEIESLKKKLLVKQNELQKTQNDKYKKIRYLPEEKYEIDKKKIIIEENKKCEKIIVNNITKLHSESNIRGIQKYCEDPAYFNEEHYLKLGFFFPGMAAYKINEEEKTSLNKLIDRKCFKFKIKFNIDYSPVAIDTFYTVDCSLYKQKIDKLYDQLKILHKNEIFPDMQVILKYCEKNNIDVKEVVKF